LLHHPIRNYSCTGGAHPGTAGAWQRHACFFGGVQHSLVGATAEGVGDAIQLSANLKCSFQLIKVVLLDNDRIKQRIGHHSNNLLQNHRTEKPLPKTKQDLNSQKSSELPKQRQATSPHLLIQKLRKRLQQSAVSKEIQSPTEDQQAPTFTKQITIQSQNISYSTPGRLTPLN
jgi:hypothetical protein